MVISETQIKEIDRINIEINKTEIRILLKHSSNNSNQAILKLVNSKLHNNLKTISKLSNLHSSSCLNKVNLTIIISQHKIYKVLEIY